LGRRWAVRLSVAYKGHWVRLLRSVGDGADPAALPWARLVPGAILAAIPGCAAEAATGSAPLSPLASLPAGAVASVAFATPAGPKGEPALIATASGAPPERLLA
jgi:hypothetical protein